MKKVIGGFGIVLLLASPAFAGPLINDHLPDWIRVDVQMRYRAEIKDNFDFNDAKDDDKGMNLWRTRVNVSLLPRENLKLFYQMQDARVSNDSTSGSKAAFEDWADTRQLYGEATDLLSWDPVHLSGLGFRLGRQELSYGAQRLIGGFNWSNVAQTFDAGKVMLSFADKKLTIDGFGGVKTPNKSPREANDYWDGSSKDVLGGYYAVYQLNKDTTIDQYFINRKTNSNVSFGPSGSGELDEFTMGGLVKGKIPETPVDYELEAAWQWGDFNDLDINAQMAVAVIGYTFDHPWKPRALFEFNYGSGDPDSSDGKRETFDNLYPTNHLHYGYMDRASLQNINNYRFQIKAQPHERVQVQTDVHNIFVDTPKDALYHAGRGVLRTATGSAGSYVGTELDLLAKVKVNPYLNFLGGYSHFFAGDYLNDTGAGDDGDFWYFQTEVQF